MSSLYTSTKMKHDLGEQAAKFAGGVLDEYSQGKTDSARHWGIARTRQGDGSRTGSRGRARLSTTSTDEMRLNRLAQQSGRVAVMLGRFRQMFAMKAKLRAWCRR